MLKARKRRFFADRLKELGRLGLALSPEFGLDNDPAREIVVEQAASPLVCPITDLPDGRTLFIVWLSLVAKRPGVRLNDFRFEPPWPDDEFRPLPDFAESHFGEQYLLPGGLDYPRHEVLNLHFAKRGWRLPCTRAEGVLCALSTTPIPAEYPHGAHIEVGVKFFGRFGEELCSTTVVLLAYRSEARIATRRTAQQPDVFGHRLADSSPKPNRSMFEQGKASGSSGASPTPNEAHGVAVPRETSERLRLAPVRHERLKMR